MIGTPCCVKYEVSGCSPETDSQPTIASTPWPTSRVEHWCAVVGSYAESQSRSWNL